MERILEKQKSWRDISKEIEKFQKVPTLRV
jgi:hypothetical protein